MLARLTATVIGLAAVAALAGFAATATAQAAQEQPNFVFIQTDDQAFDDLYATFRGPNGARQPVMPATRNRIGRRGVSFLNHYITYPTCCPSRTATLTGRYNHNNGVLGNTAPNGGWQAFRRSSNYRENLPVWLQRVGYRTVHIGKFLNQYGSKRRPSQGVPPGWTEWQTNATEGSNRAFYGYLVNVNGEIEGPFGDPEYGFGLNSDYNAGCLRGPPVLSGCNHQTDQMTRRAVEQIKVSARDEKPFYLQLDYIAPHGDHSPPIGPEPTPRNYGRAEGTPLPRAASFDEADVSDKPRFISEGPGRLDANELRRMRIEYRRTLESLRDIDDGVREILRALNRSGVIDNTYVIFTSDNGFFRGHHRLARGKILPYEPSARSPLLIRGPGITPNTTTAELTANIDLAPTLIKLTGANARRPIDGRNLEPFWLNPELRTRRPIVLESFARPADVEPGDRGEDWSAHAYLNYVALRLGSYKFIRYETGETELYDLATDPDEQHNQTQTRRYQRLKRFLRRQLNTYADCARSACRERTGKLPDTDRPRMTGRWQDRRVRSR